MRTAIVYPFDLIEHVGEDLRDRPFLGRKATLARVLCEQDRHTVCGHRWLSSLASMSAGRADEGISTLKRKTVGS
jgi:ATP-dependent DNA ligase